MNGEADVKAGRGGSTLCPVGKWTSVRVGSPAGPAIAGPPGPPPPVRGLPFAAHPSSFCPSPLSVIASMCACATAPAHVIASSSSHPQSSGNSGIVGNHYRVGKKIGEGSFGVVFEGLHNFLRSGLQRVVWGPSAIILNFHAIAGAALWPRRSGYRQEADSSIRIC